jgi:hypothetical protein
MSSTNAWAASCVDEVKAAIEGLSTGTEASTIWRSKLSKYFSAKSPDFGEVEDTLKSLENLDTSRPQIRSNLDSIALDLQKVATGLASKPPSSHAGLVELQARSKKLRLLNTPAIRNLLGNEELESQVGSAAWAYNRALWDKGLNVAAKREAISRSIKNAKNAGMTESELATLGPLPAVKVEPAELFDVHADAVVATIECDGFCGSNINSVLRNSIGEKIKGRKLRDGETLTVSDKKSSSINPRNYVLVVDDQKLPLRDIVSRSLLEAEKSGFKSVTLPVLRSGYAFGAVETSSGQVAAELRAGIAKYQAEGNGKLTEVTFALPKNQLLADRLKKVFAETKKARERSLREDLRPVTLSGRGFSMTPSAVRPKVDTSTSPIYRDMLKPWDLSHMLDVHAPVRVGTLVDREAFSKPVVSVLNMPIKMPGTDYRVPEELGQFREMLQKIIDHEAEANPHLDEFYAYLTVDNSPVKKGNTHRRGGIHIDGVQGARYPVKLPPEHTYSASDKVGTVFYNQPFDLRKLDPNRHHVHAELERQAKPESRIATEDYGLYFWDSYSAHEAAVSDIDANRTFVRVEFSKKIYDGVGDTQSPMFDYHWPRIPRPIPEALDDRPITKLIPETKGYATEIAHIKPWAPHTVKNLEGYLNDNLGVKTVQSVRKGESPVLVVVGDGAKALDQARELNWQIGNRIVKKEGFHRIFEAKDPSGKDGFVVSRVNGDDRVLHIQSLFKLAGEPASAISTVGRTRPWRAEYRQVFDSMGYVPDLVVYGFANSVIDSTLLRNGFKNGRHFATLSRNYKKKLSAVAGDTKSDLEGMNMQVLELADGRRVWFLHCMFGDLASDLIGAVADHGAKNITFIGSAGSLDPNVRFGSFVIPSVLRRANGKEEPLKLPAIPGISLGGQYLRVPTPNVGTQEWTQRTRASGIDFVESELEHVVDEVNRHPGVNFKAALVISEVASGPNHRDMTEWGYSDLRALFPDLNRIMDNSLNATDNSPYVIKSYKSVPLLPAGKEPSDAK